MPFKRLNWWKLISIFLTIKKRKLFLQKHKIKISWLNLSAYSVLTVTPLQSDIFESSKARFTIARSVLTDWVNEWRRADLNEIFTIPTKWPEEPPRKQLPLWTRFFNWITRKKLPETYWLSETQIFLNMPFNLSIKGLIFEFLILLSLFTFLIYFLIQ